MDTFLLGQLITIHTESNTLNVDMTSKRHHFEFAFHFTNTDNMVSLSFDTEDFELLNSDLTSQAITNPSIYDFISPMLQILFTTDDGEYEIILNYNFTQLEIFNNKI